MKIYLMLPLVMVLGQFIYAQEMIKLWGEDAIGRELALADPGSATEGGVTRLSNVTNPNLKVYEPPKKVDNGDAIIVCPGGGYQILAIDLEGSEIAEWLSGIGYTVYVLEYRVPDQPHGAFQDVQRAIKVVRSKLDGDSKLGILGFSAGGHLAASAATRFAETAYEPIDEKDTLSDRPDFAVLIYPAYLDKGEGGTLSPEITLNPETPPFFIFMTADDKYAGSSTTMAEALRKNKTLVEFHLLPEGGHGYGLRKGSYAAETWPSLLEKWLKNQ